MSNQSLTEFVVRTTWIFGSGYILSRAAISIYNYFTSKGKKADEPWNLDYPTFEFLVGRPDGTDSQLVHNTIRKYLDQQPITATCTI